MQLSLLVVTVTQSSRPWPQCKDNGGTGPSSWNMPSSSTNLSAERSNIIWYKKPGWSSLGTLHVIFSLLHDCTNSSCHYFLSPTFIFYADPRLRWKLSLIILQSIAEVAILLYPTRGRRPPCHGVPPNRSLSPRNCCQRIKSFALSTGLDKSLADVPVQYQNSNMSGMQATGALWDQIPWPTLLPNPVQFIRVGPVNLCPHVGHSDHRGGLPSASWRCCRSLTSKSLDGYPKNPKSHVAGVLFVWRQLSLPPACTPFQGQKNSPPLKQKNEYPSHIIHDILYHIPPFTGIFYVCRLLFCSMLLRSCAINRAKDWQNPKNFNFCWGVKFYPVTPPYCSQKYHLPW